MASRASRAIVVLGFALFFSSTSGMQASQGEGTSMAKMLGSAVGGMACSTAAFAGAAVKQFATTAQARVLDMSVDSEQTQKQLTFLFEGKPNRFSTWRRA